MKRLVAMVVGLLSILVVPMTGASPAGATPKPAPTQEIHLRPVDANAVLTAGYRVTRTLDTATCAAGADVVRGAYRCFVGTTVVEPCWVNAGTLTSVVCVAAPWSHNVTRLVVPSGLQPSPVEGKQPVWGLQLTSGPRCLAVQGVQASVHGLTVNDSCGTAMVLLGPIDRSGPLWTVRTATKHGSTMVMGPLRSIKTVWYALPSPALPAATAG